MNYPVLIILFSKAWAQPWPGLVGTNVNLTTGLFVDASGGWNGGDDSFYEYLIKMYVYDTARFSSYKDRWVLAADSTMANLASHPSSRPELTFLAMFENTTLVYDSGHLACFDGGNFILGGLSLGEQRYVDFGLELVEACENTYNQVGRLMGKTLPWSETCANPLTHRLDFTPRSRNSAMSELRLRLQVTSSTMSTRRCSTMETKMLLQLDSSLVLKERLPLDDLSVYSSCSGSVRAGCSCSS